MHKIQAVFEGDVTKEDIESRVSLLAIQSTGKFFTLIIKGSLNDITENLKPLNPLAMESIPLTLEEVFLYEMEAKGYDAKVIFR